MSFNGDCNCETECEACLAKGRGSPETLLQERNGLLAELAIMKGVRESMMAELAEVRAELLKLQLEHNTCQIAYDHDILERRNEIEIAYRTGWTCGATLPYHSKVGVNEYVDDYLKEFVK